MEEFLASPLRHRAAEPLLEIIGECAYSLWLNETGEAAIVTKNGRPVAALHPNRQRRRHTLFGLHSVVDYGSDLAEISSADEWHLLTDSPVKR